MENTNKKPGSKNPAVIKWELDFEKEPLTSLDNLLMRRVYMGALNRNEISEILFRIFHTSKADLLDNAICEWLQKNWGKVPSSMPLARWSALLSQVFITIDRLKLNKSYKFACKKYIEDRIWLKSLYKGSGNDPEGSLLRMLARGQKNQSLMPLWFKIINMQEDMPTDYASIAILGIRIMPEKDGSPPGDIGDIVLKSFFDLAKALKKNQPYNLKKAKEFWTLKLSSIMGLYPRTEQYWIKKFIPLATNEQNKTAVKWLNSVLPNFHKKLNSSDKVKKSYKPQQYPNQKETDRIINLLKKSPSETKQLNTFISKSINYAMNTGYSKNLVKAFHRTANALLEINIDIAERLAEEAYLWEPYDPFIWILRANIHKQKKEYKKAESILWKAKRKFPEDDFIRNNLAHHLFKTGETNLAEAVYRETIADFPEDEVCSTGLATLLSQQDRLDEAETIYKRLLEKQSPDFEHYKRALDNILWLKDIKDTGEKKKHIHNIINSAVDSKNKIYSAAPDNNFNKLQKTELTEEDIEIKIGRINLYRGLSVFEKEKNKKAEYTKKADNFLKEIEKDYPDNIFVIKEQAWHYSYSESEEADLFFEKNSEEYDNDLGINIAELRYKHLAHNNGTEDEWKQLYQNFPKQKTAIALEQLIQGQNGYYNETKNAQPLNILKKRIKADTTDTFDPNQKRENWFCQTIANSLFAGFENINTVNPKPIFENLSPQNKAILFRASEQYISADR
ncbi:MAG: tetratricopeptide repeat protein [Deltaproteobacteria bacterium]|nr:tetratricopeptide repeat protein [Deltaproteobacteria bacterium]